MAAPKLPKWNPGDEITAKDLNLLARAIQEIAIQPGQSTGLDIARTPGGTVVRVRQQTIQFLALTTTTVTPRSGTTPGTGTVQLVTYDSSTNTMYPFQSGGTPITEDVLNFSAAGTGIPSGKYCWVGRDANGYLWLLSSEC